MALSLCFFRFTVFAKRTKRNFSFFEIRLSESYSLSQVLLLAKRTSGAKPLFLLLCYCVKRALCAKHLRFILYGALSEIISLSAQLMLLLTF